MVINKFPFYVLSIIITLLFHHVYQVDGQSNNIPGRVYPGCALSNDKLYCYGGFSGNPIDNNGLTYTNTFTDYLELDLAAFDNFTSFNSSNIQWTKRANDINGVPIVGAADIATTTLSDGSIIMYGGRSNRLIDFPFARYNPHSNTWNSVSIPNNTYYLRSRIVNLGNDSIWMFGGDIRVIGQTPEVMLRVYDFNSGSWPVSLPLLGDSPIDHTSTIVNGIIYLIGGGFLQASSNRTYKMTPFTYIQTFNTMDSSWGNFTATGNVPTNRGLHSTVATSDNKYLIIYGGIVPSSSLFQKSKDVYCVLDIENRSFKNYSLSNPPGSNTPERFGHFGTIYKSNYLLLAFGYNDLTSAAENLNVLNIQNVYEPSWVALPANTPINNNNTSNSTESNPSSNEVNLKTVVPAVVVPVTVALLGIAVGAFLFIRQRKKRQQKAFILEKEDPRNMMDHQEYGNLLQGEIQEDKGGAVTTVKESNASSSVKTDYQTQNTLVMNEYQSNDHQTILYGKADLPNDNIPDSLLVKPFESNPTTKPFEP
ncbi:unnamed protein product [Cunninghamella blakesleeana]